MSSFGAPNGYAEEPIPVPAVTYLTGEVPVTQAHGAAPHDQQEIARGRLGRSGSAAGSRIRASPCRAEMCRQSHTTMVTVNATTAGRSQAAGNEDI